MAENALALPAAGQSPLRSFFVIWTGQVFSWFGSELVQFSLIWWLTGLTGSAIVLALSTMMAVLPRLLLGPFAGALVDRWNRRVVMIAADGMIALATLVIALLYGFGVIQVWHIYVLMAIRAAGSVFHLPAMVASTQLLVPQKHLARVTGLNQALGNTASIVSPPLGALLLRWLPMQGILSIDILTALIAITPLLFIPIPQPPASRLEVGIGLAFIRVILSDLKEGFAFIWNWKGFRILVAIVLLLNLLAYPAAALIPILVTRHFHGGPFELAWFQSMLGIGGIMGGLALGVWGGFRRRIVTLLVALILDGAGLLLVILTPGSAFPLALPAIFLAGMMGALVNGAAIAIMQTTVPAEKFGCVFSMQLSLATAMAPIGLAIAGPTGDAFGPRPWFLLFAAIVILTGAAGFLIPDLMRIEEKRISLPVQ